MADYSISVGDEDLRSRLGAAIDREGKIPRAIEALGPIADRRVLLLDADTGLRARQLEALGARVTALPGMVVAHLPRGLADVVVSFWAGFPGDSPETLRQVEEAERVLRPGGRLLLIQDYGRDDVSRLVDAGATEHAADGARRDSWFLLHDFKLRVLHCWWTFDSLEEAHDLLVAGFGQRGTELAMGMRRPRLEYKVAVYHRTLGAPDGSPDEAPDQDTATPDQDTATPEAA